MALASGIGAIIEQPAGVPAHAFLFGEDQARYVLTARPQDVAQLLADAAAVGVPLQRIGTTGRAALTIAGEQPILLSDLAKAHEGWLPAFMAGDARK